MQAITGIDNAPVFCPIVADFYSGMTVTVPLFRSQLSCGVEEIKKLYAEKYRGEVVEYVEGIDDNGFVSGLKVGKKDGMKISVAGNEERILLIAAYDNLGKGASGAAIECMNIALGVEKTKGLEL